MPLNETREITTPEAISFRPLQVDDLPQLYRWLNNPRVFRWYGGAWPSVAEVEAKYTPRIAGQSPTRPYLIVHAAMPVGYIQTYLVVTDPDYAAIVGDSDGAAAIDIFIGEDEYAGRGLGAAAIRAFLREIIFRDPALIRCYIDPHPENSVAIRAYTRAGFRQLRRVDPPPPEEPCLLMSIERAEFEGGAMSAITEWSPTTIAASREEIREVFAAAFVMPEDEASRFVGHLATHATRRDFRFFAARDGDAGALLGFIYGYTGEPGQWFHDRIRAGLAPEMAERWLADAYEVVEFGVRPEAQGRGLGGQLHDALVRSLTNRTAILSTRQEETAAIRLYRRRGWQPLLTDYRFPSTTKLYTILGLDLQQQTTR